MSIILKALKKIQEQEADQAPGTALGETSPEERNASGASFASHPAEPEHPHIVRAQAAPRYSFGFGIKALLGLLVVLGIAATGWFANRIYLNLQTTPEAARNEAPAVVEEPAKLVRAAPPAEHVEPESSAPVPATVPAVAEAPVAPPAAPSEPVTVAATSAPEPRAPEPEVSNVAPAQPVQPTPARPPITIEVPPVESSGPAPSVPVMKEARPTKSGRPELKINAIAWQNEEPRAIVNMQRVYEGDVIEGATVVAIKRKIIVFEYDGEIFEVRF